MNSADVIRKISKKAGVPDTENKKFFEIFLKQTSGILNPGESIMIPGVGGFQLRLGQIENPAAAGPQYVYSKLIVFTAENDPATESPEIYFNAPDDIENEYHSIDSYFSLSIGKPVIPLKGVKPAEFFIPPSGPEMRGLFESKISRLFEEAEKLSGGKETEVILLKQDIKDVDLNSAEEKLPIQSDFMKTREFENLSWDFGETLSQEIDEETLEEIKDEPKQFENVPVKEREAAPHFEEEDFEPEPPDEEMFEEVIDEETDWIEPENESEHDPLDVQQDKSLNEAEEMIYKTESKPIEETDEFIESDLEPRIFESGLEGREDEQKEDVKPPDIEMEENDIDESVSGKTNQEDLFMKNFQRVSSLTKEFNISVDEEKEEKEDEKSLRRITEVRGGFQKVRRTTAEFNFDFSRMKGLDEDEKVSESKEKDLKSYEGYRKPIMPSIIIASVVILALAGILYMYLNLKNENNKTETSKPQTRIIERNFDVPATYPNDSTAKAGTMDNENEDQLKNSSVNSVQGEISEPVNAQRIENYIYQYPEGIVVQVSSWKSKSTAVNEVKKYRESGYTAFAEMSEIPGMGVYYRVRVGYFKSLNEAKEFANGNQ